eukprot:8834206-Pyramimonas_sp.AAC.1
MVHTCACAQAGGTCISSPWVHGTVTGNNFWSRQYDISPLLACEDGWCEWLLLVHIIKMALRMKKRTNELGVVGLRVVIFVQVN